MFLKIRLRSVVATVFLAAVSASFGVGAIGPDGRKIYNFRCYFCHGYSGDARTLAAQMLDPVPRDFTSVTVEPLSRENMLDAVRNGRPGTAMQSFLDVGLKQQDIDDLVSYIRSFESSQAAAGSAEDEAAAPPALIFDSPYDFDATILSLKSALEGRNFRHLPDRHLEKGLADDTMINRRQMTVRYCNFELLYRMMRVEPRLGVGLPCRITVVEGDDGSVRLIAMNLRLIAKLFNNDQLRDLADEMHEVQLEIIDEALL